MKFKRIGSDLIYNVTNPEVVPLFQGSDYYEEVIEDQDQEKEKKPTRKSSRK